jgi:hypothetical protein
VIRGAITIAALVAAFIGLARVGVVHGQMCLSQVGCVTAAKHDAAFQRSPTTAKQKRVHAIVEQARSTTVALPTG